MMLMLKTFDFEKHSPEDALYIGFYKNFPRFSGKHLYRSLIFDIVVGLQPPVTLTHIFSCEYGKFLRTPFL